MNNIAKKGEKIYSRIKSDLKQFSPHDYVTIETETGKYFVGPTVQDAYDKAKKQFPHKTFFLSQVNNVNAQWPSLHRHFRHETSLSR